jgi:integrase
MSVRKRVWRTKQGRYREAFIVDYADQTGRHHKTFDRWSEANEFWTTITNKIQQGTHVPDKSNITVKEAGLKWLKRAETDGLERTTVGQYEQHLRLHIIPFLGDMMIRDVTVPVVKDFRDGMREGDPRLTAAEIAELRRRIKWRDFTLKDHEHRAVPRSPAMIRGVVASLGALLAEAMEDGLISHNAVRELRQNRKRGSKRSDRHKRKLVVGEDIPTPEEVSALLAAADRLKSEAFAAFMKAKAKASSDPRNKKNQASVAFAETTWRTQVKWRVLLLTVVFTGLRASELRGLRWSDVDLKKGELHVRQRADRFNVVGNPKSTAGQRSVPLTPTLTRELGEWRLQCPKKDGRLQYVFPNTLGGIDNHVNMVSRGLAAIMREAKVIKPVTEFKTDKRGKGKRVPVLEPKYGGMHMLRHYFASWCLNREADGGLELPPKVVQERLGHASITMTMDTYGHLFPRGDDSAALAKAERRLLSLHSAQS